ALLFIRDAQLPIVVHVDLAAPSLLYDPVIDLAAGFAASMTRYNASILDADLVGSWPAISEQVLALLDDPADRQTFDTLVAALLVISHRCWAGEKEAITRGDLLSTFGSLRGDARISDDLLARLIATLE